MRVSLVVALAALLPACAGISERGASSLPELSELTDDTVIDRSVRIRPGVYRIEDLGDDGVLHVTADDVVLDLSGVTLIGAAPGVEPDRLTGIGIRADGVERLTVRHGTVRGFRVGLEIVGGSGHTVLATHFSDNFRQRLASTPDVEDSGDWLWPHENDDDEWADRYGAAVHLKEVSGSAVDLVEVRRGQNGIILNRCRDVEVRRCDASFLSGWGLAMWRTVDSRIVDNRFDFCVRGYSHGTYARGQDSSGILVFEQCSRNLFARNSATHGGDGFFLYAGNETLRETGEGGSNDNRVIENDFSHAVANAIEATFSRGNQFERNILRDSNYGVWAGYSYDSWIVGNHIAQNAIAGVAIEHGRDHRIIGNTFEQNPVAVSLWWDEDPDLTESAFGRVRSTESTGNIVHDNTFQGDLVGIELRDAASTIIGTNDDRSSESLRRSGRGEVYPLDPSDAESLSQAGTRRPPRHEDSYLPLGARRGRNRIFVDQWGPYDFTGQRAWPPRVGGVAAARVHLLGPDLAYRIDSIAGDIEVGPRAGMLPGTVQVRPRDGATGVIPFTFVAVSEAGEITVRGSLFALPWEVRYYRWERVGAGEPPADWAAVRAGEPLVIERRSDLELRPGSGSPAEGVPADHFATVATSTFTLPAGPYTLRVLSDDGVRVRLDGRVVHEDWTWHAPRSEDVAITLSGGEHTLEVEHFEIDGHAVLGVVLLPGEAP